MPVKQLYYSYLKCKVVVQCSVSIVSDIVSIVSNIVNIVSNIVSVVSNKYIVSNIVSNVFELSMIFVCNTPR